MSTKRPNGHCIFYDLLAWGFHEDIAKFLSSESTIINSIKLIGADSTQSIKSCVKTYVISKKLANLWTFKVPCWEGLNCSPPSSAARLQILTYLPSPSPWRLRRKAASAEHPSRSKWKQCISTIPFLRHSVPASSSVLSPARCPALPSSASERKHTRQRWTSVAINHRSIQDFASFFPFFSKGDFKTFFIYPPPLISIRLYLNWFWTQKRNGKSTWWPLMDLMKDRKSAAEL